MGQNLWGVGMNWGEPNESTWGSGLRDQYTFEVFYRINITQQLAVTPDLQWIKDPTNNPAEDSIWILGVRARMTF